MDVKSSTLSGQRQRVLGTFESNAITTDRRIYAWRDVPPKSLSTSILSATTAYRSVFLCTAIAGGLFRRPRLSQPWLEGVRKRGTVDSATAVILGRRLSAVPVVFHTACWRIFVGVLTV